MKKFLVALTAAGLLGLWACSSAPKNPWAEVQAPSTGPAHAIGKPGAGCVTGAVALDPSGEGFEVAHLERRRFFGHPLMIDFLQQMGVYAKSIRFSRLKIGDIGMARGGPMPTGHASHQIGLDADIWFEASGHSMLVSGTTNVDGKRWSRAQEQILKKAVSFEQVDRIFVNPAIKRDLCVRDQYAPWLSKLRPWWGHDDHWHVRLKCPASDRACVATEAIPAGNGCDETLNWWFSEEAKKKGEESTARSNKLPTLPSECAKVLAR